MREEEPAKAHQQLIRPLGDMEKVFWATSLSGNANIALVARVAGDIHPARLSDALRAVQKRHPLLSVHVELDQDGCPQFYRDPAFSIPLRTAIREGDHSWIRETEAELNNAINASTSPLWRAVLLEGDSLHEIIFCCHHAIGDGLAAAFLLRDLLRHLAGETALPGLPIRPPFEELFLPLRFLGEQSGSPSTFSLPAGSPAMVDSDLQQVEAVSASRFKLNYWQLDRELTACLIRACQRRGVTVHSALCAAFLSSWVSTGQHSDQCIVRCQTPINSRGLCPPVEDDFGLYVSALICSYQFRGAIDFWTLAQSVKQQLEDGKKSEKLAAVHSALGEIAKLPGAKQIAAICSRMVGYEFALTNLGELPIDVVYDRFELQELWGPMGIFNPAADTIGVATINRKLSISITSVTDRLDLASLAIGCLRRAVHDDS
jgi:hypothetical protein